MGDILIGINEVAADKAMQFLYSKQSLREKLFQGELTDITPNIIWRIDEAPQIIFSPPSFGGGSFSMRLNKFTLCICGAEITLPIEVCGNATVKDTKSGIRLSLTIMDIKPDTSGLNSGDVVLCKASVKAITPMVLEKLNTVLSGIPVPDINIGGIAFTNFSVVIGNHGAGIYGTLPGRSAGSPPALPNREVFAALSREAVAAIANKFLPAINGKSESASGSQSFGIGKASYECSVTINKAYATVSSSPTSISAYINITPKASANATVMFIPIDIGYKGHVNPADVSVSMMLGINGEKLNARIDRLGGFSIVLEPAGSISSQILSGIAWPLAQSMVSILTPLVSNMAVGMKFDLIDVDFDSVDVAGTRVTPKPSNLTVGEFSGMLLLSGGVTIS